LRKAETMLGLLVVALVLAPGRLRAQWTTTWSYERSRGPEHWGELDPTYAACRDGKEQSPVDTRNTKKARLPALRFEYESGPLKYLINNGKTIRVNYHDAPGKGNFLIVGERRYQLRQFHFHRPGEEYVHGKPYEMVAHLMHQADAGEIAGVVVLLKAGKANNTVRQIWEHMPTAEGKEQEVPGVQVNPLGLLPGDFAYYRYRGSLTAPPCTEGVAWFVLKTPAEISAEQINAFAALYPHDVRPPQPLNGRIIEESQ
jgi:carbonic anhydrase